MELLDCLAGERVPVAHRHKAMRIKPLIPQFVLQCARLTFRVPADGRASADGGVVMLHFAGAGG